MHVKRFPVLLSIASLCVSQLAAMAITADASKQLVQLENKFFEHTYDGDTVEQRTERLEKLILGGASTGDPEARIKKLAASAGAAQVEADELNPSAQPLKPTAPATRQAQTKTADAGDLSQEYPHVDALESAILGKTYAGQPLAARIARMESKVFGAPNANDDLSTRTDALDQYVEKKFPQKAMPVASDSDDVPVSQGSYPRVTTLESTILGRTYVDEALPQRINRLEVAAFGKTTNSDDLGDRADALEKYAAQKYPQKFAQQQKKIENVPATANANDNSQQSAGGHPHGKQALVMAADALLGLASMASPVGFGGFGPGMYGPPRSRVQNVSQEETIVDKSADDPLVSAPTPPPADARLLSKVGWCEMQLFGKTYTDMHLEERLQQLSAELNFDTKKSGLQLMDHVGDMIKLVQARKPASVGTNPTSQTE